MNARGHSPQIHLEVGPMNRKTIKATCFILCFITIAIAIYLNFCPSSGCAHTGAGLYSVLFPFLNQ